MKSYEPKMYPHLINFSVLHFMKFYWLFIYDNFYIFNYSSNLWSPNINLANPLNLIFIILDCFCGQCAENFNYFFIFLYCQSFVRFNTNTNHILITIPDLLNFEECNSFLKFDLSFKPNNYYLMDKNPFQNIQKVSLKILIKLKSPKAYCK